MEKRDYKFKVRNPQSVVSDTLPNQTVDLKVLVRQLLNGQALNVGLSLTSDVSESFDSVDVSKLDIKHMTINDIDAMIAKFNPPKEVEETEVS